MVSVGACLALARRGGGVAVAVVKRYPVMAIAGAVALAGVGLAVAAAKRRKAAAENGDASVARPRRIVAKNVRGSSRTVVDKPAAKKAARPRKTRTTVSKSTS
jgi:endonuclease/exonuclease/phosphatase (EEP) superfamily protein YafD